MRAFQQTTLDRNFDYDNDDFDLDIASVEVAELLKGRRICSRQWGTATAAKLAAVFLPDWEEPIHPTSAVGLRMQAIVEGVADATVQRIVAHFPEGEREEKRDQFESWLYERK